MPVFAQNDTTFKLIKLNYANILCDNASVDLNFTSNPVYMTSGISNTPIRDIGNISKKVTLSGPCLITQDGFLGEQDIIIIDKTTDSEEPDAIDDTLYVIDVPTLCVDLITDTNEYGILSNRYNNESINSLNNDMPVIESISLAFDNSSGLTGNIILKGNTQNSNTSLYLNYISNRLSTASEDDKTNGNIDSKDITNYGFFAIDQGDKDLSGQPNTSSDFSNDSNSTITIDYSSIKTENGSDPNDGINNYVDYILQTPFRTSNWYDFGIEYSYKKDDVFQYIDIGFNNFKIDINLDWRNIDFIGKQQIETYAYYGGTLKWSTEMTFKFPNYINYQMIYQLCTFIISNQTIQLKLKQENIDDNLFRNRLVNIMNNFMYDKSISLLGKQTKSIINDIGANLMTNIKIDHKFPISTIVLSGERIIS